MCVLVVSYALFLILFFCVFSVASLASLSDFFYAIEIRIVNPGAFLFKEHVLLRLNTALLLSQGRIATCSDFRFYDGASMDLSLPYWVEGRCGASETVIWVQVSDIGPTKLIYMLYGTNATLASTLLPWPNGRFITGFSSNTCPGGWVSYNIPDERYIRSGATVGATMNQPMSHNHVFEKTTSPLVDVQVDFVNTIASSPTAHKSLQVPLLGVGHSHYFTTGILNFTNAGVLEPSYYNVHYCISGVLDLFNDGFLMMFDEALINMDSSFWVSVPESFDRLLRGSSVAVGSFGGTSNHTHVLTSFLTLGHGATATALFNDNLGLATCDDYDHTHAIEFALNGMTVSRAQHMPQHLSITLGRKRDLGRIGGTAVLNKVGQTMILSVTSLPPIGWELIPQFQGGSYCVMSKSIGTPLSLGGSNVHRHGFAGVTRKSGSFSNTISDTAVGGICVSEHTHDITASLSSFGDSLVSTTDLIFARRMATLGSVFGDGSLCQVLRLYSNE